MRVPGAEVAAGADDAAPGGDGLRHPRIERDEAVDVAAGEQRRLFRRAGAHQFHGRRVEAHTAQVGVVKYRPIPGNTPMVLIDCGVTPGRSTTWK